MLQWLFFTVENYIKYCANITLCYIQIRLLKHVGLNHKRVREIIQVVRKLDIRYCIQWDI